MKKYYLLFFLLAMQFAGYTQQIQKMKADELSAYIAKSEKPLIVSFWATWCASCVEEIPYFISTIKEKYGSGVELLLVSLDIKSYYPKRIESFAAKKKFDVPIVWLNEPNADIFCPLIDPKWSGAIPSTLMINNKKKYRKFYETGMSPLQFERNLEILVE
ncbi:MAG TPA: TlpA disulfide reductase family protein [Chitinophagaceae bacterium]|nr:TlpA disulfide reductase family protein [Chitinophagaceae bacterium]